MKKKLYMAYGLMTHETGTIILRDAAFEVIVHTENDNVTDEELLAEATYRAKAELNRRFAPVPDATKITVTLYEISAGLIAEFVSL